MEKKCRDCKKCTEREITTLTKKAANAVLIAGTLGVSVVGAMAMKVVRQNCPACGHPVTDHQVVAGRFKD